MNEYEFNDKYTESKTYEKEIDAYFSKDWDIVHVSRELESLGIDAIWTSKVSGFRNTFEYKGDEKATETNRIFIETESISTTGKLGWGYTSCAQYLLTYLPSRKLVYIAYMLKIKTRLRKWLEKANNNEPNYIIGKAPNNGYYTTGVCIPIEEFEKCCIRKINIGDKK